MNSIKILVVMAAVALSSCIASAANFSGKWVIPAAGALGQKMEIVLLINQAGSFVTGTLAGSNDASTGSPANSELFDATVDGNTISFYVWRGTDQPVKQFYKGTLAGDEIHFTVTGGASRPHFGPNGFTQSAPPASEEVTARRAR